MTQILKNPNIFVLKLGNAFLPLFLLKMEWTILLLGKLVEHKMVKRSNQFTTQRK